MPMHDWTLVPDGIYHAFHQRWISAISDRLNTGILPPEMYALPEQVTGGFSPDVLTLQQERPEQGDAESGGVATALRTRPTTRFTALSEAEFYRRKKNVIAIRHVSGDKIVALIEIVSPGNKSGEYQIDSFVRKDCEFLDRGVHLLILDPFPPGPRDPDASTGSSGGNFSPSYFTCFPTSLSRSSLMSVNSRFGPTSNSLPSATRSRTCPSSSRPMAASWSRSKKRTRPRSRCSRVAGATC